MRLIRCAALALLLAGCQEQGPATGTTPQSGEMLAVPVAGQEIQARLCRPDGPGPAPLAVINHGSPPDAAQRPGMRPTACEAEAVRWFTRRGFAVLLPLRRGYGGQGAWAETSGACASPDFAGAGHETARDIRAAIATATALPGIRPDRVLVVGQSAGGWGALALAAENPPEVAAVVNMAGGRGGWAQRVPNTNCRPDRLVAAAGEYGRTARIPVLSIYTANDTFFAPALAAEMQHAFAAGGAPLRFEALGPWGRDGHGLFFGQDGSTTWGRVVAPWLRERGLLAAN